MKSTSNSFQQTKEKVDRKWHVIDVKGKVLGRVSTEIAHLLQGKHKVTFTPHVDSGDYVVVINALEVDVTGNKRTDKTYYTHSLFPGGIKAETFDKKMARQPEQIIQRSVKGMLPKNTHRDQRMARLKVYPGSEHPHHIENKEEKAA